MFLAIDIGNTNISLGIFKQGRLLKSKDFPTRQTHKQKSAFRKFINKIKIDDCFICSVVPLAEKRISSLVKSAIGKRPLIIEKDIKIPIKNKYKSPKEVGTDRLLNAFGGSLLYRHSLILVDFGTAVTFDVVTEKREYLGGLIFPGLSLSLDALYNRTALLPKVRLTRPKGLIGKTTKESILNGIVYGFSALTDDIVLRLAKGIKKPYSVVATGGSTDLLRKYIKRIDYIQNNLTLKAISLLYRYYHEKKD
ncbi:MAG: type III pantothenate kinase [Candidatus Gygaella obscura]|nr:type III pantothenate kinase [Candidatus Gygaella obscura]